MKLQVTESFYFSEDIRQLRFHAIYCNFSSVLFSRGTFSLSEIVQSLKFKKNTNIGLYFSSDEGISNRSPTAQGL